jgi:DNA-binding GntR family transcriptional regulator
MNLKITPKTVQSMTVKKIRDAILTGHFKPGQRLTEAALCQIMNVSRTSVRESLRRLEGERLIVIVPNKGPSVAEISWPEAEEIYQVRSLLEAEAAALFAQRATPVEIKKMKAALDGYAKAMKNFDTIGRLNTTSIYYDVLQKGCGNMVIGETLEGLMARINLLRSRSMSRPGRSQRSLAEMRDILHAIAAHDATEARRATKRHIDAAAAAAKEAFNLAAQKANTPNSAADKAQKQTAKPNANGRAPRVKRRK